MRLYDTCSIRILRLRDPGQDGVWLWERELSSVILKLAFRKQE